MAQHVNRQLRRRPRYPWDEWMDGKTWRIVQGTDFNCNVDSMRSAIYAQAKKNDKEVSTSCTEGEGIIEFCFD